MPPVDQNEAVIAKAKDFWTRYSKVLIITSVVVIILAGGYLGYKYIYKAPEEVKAQTTCIKQKNTIVWIPQNSH
ncbi:MAG: hypothetical protein WDO19_21710 [Bacteroidota bacterium]